MTVSTELTAAGLASIGRRLAAGPATIAYLGNSVTAQKEGYRPRLHERLCAHFSHEHRAVNAAFGGVGAIGSVCTMDDSVIRHRPDLCFIECLTGDMGVGLHPNTGAALEGMVRKLARIGCAPCILNLPRRDAESAGRPEILALYRRLIDAHRLPAVSLTAERRTPGLFRDDVHTMPEGGEQVAQAVFDGLTELFERPDTPTPAGARLFEADFGEAGVLRAHPSMVRAGPVRTGLFRLRPYVDLQDGAVIVFDAAGTALVGLLVVYGPHSGAVEIHGERHVLRDRWCHYDRAHAYVLPTEIARSPVFIRPVAEEAPSRQGRLKIMGFLTRPVRTDRH